MIKQEYLELKIIFISGSYTLTHNNIDCFDRNGKENAKMFHEPRAKLSIFVYLVAMPTKQFRVEALE